MSNINTLKKLEINLQQIIERHFNNIKIDEFTNYDFYNETTIYGVILSKTKDFYAFKIEKDKLPELIKI